MSTTIYIKTPPIYLIPVTEGQVRQYFMQSANPRNVTDPTANSYDGKFNKKILKVSITKAQAKQFRNVFNNDVYI